jgi:hypothetical protein
VPSTGGATKKKPGFSELYHMLPFCVSLFSIEFCVDWMYVQSLSNLPPFQVGKQHINAQVLNNLWI